MVDANVVTWALLLVVAVSFYRGVKRGASGSAKQLLFFLIGAIATVAAIVASAFTAAALSPRLQSWLADWIVAESSADDSLFEQAIHTVAVGVRDLPLLRFSLLFLLFYTLFRWLAGLITGTVSTIATLPLSILPSGGALGRAVGGFIGAAMGAGRALLLTAILFTYCAIFPRAQMTDYIEESELYREVAAQVIRPATGSLLTDRLPVFAQSFNEELTQLWQRRYDVIDAQLPEDIVEAAVTITEGLESDEEKAEALYEWIGSRIAYDYDKANAYIDRGEWREQNPATTFASRRGVCIDYARLYAAMARAVGLDARVVTGLGYDGRGGYGPHAWNEVYLAELDRWAPLDATWAISGDWFDVAGFADTHIEQA